MSRSSLRDQECYRDCDHLDYGIEAIEKKEHEETADADLLSSTSSSSSAPPDNFDVIDKGQYEPILFEDAVLNHSGQHSSEQSDSIKSVHHLNVIEESIVLDEKKVQEGMLEIRLRALKRKTKTLKNLRDCQSSRLKETQKLVIDTKSQVETEKKSCLSLSRKIELMRKHIASRQGSVKKRHNAKTELVEDLKQHINRRVFQLASDVFTIEEINLLEHNGSNVNMETSPLLTFSDSSHYQIEEQTAYSIVEPWLPSNGDYSAYSLWLNDNRNGHQGSAPMSALSQRNPAFRISAALTYTTQLVNNLAAYLDVILPAKLDIDMFSGEPLNDTQFSYHVAKLNANVIHLCISQGIDISLLSPQRTLKNLMFLYNLNIGDLGRIPIIELENEIVAQKIEDHISADLALVREELYDFTKYADEDDVSDSEWEISDTVVDHDIELQIRTNEQSIQQNSYIMSRLTFPRLIASFWTSN